MRASLFLTSLLTAALCLGANEIAVRTGLSTHGLIGYHDVNSRWVLLLAPVVIVVAARGASVLLGLGVAVFAGALFANLLATHLWEKGVPDYIYIGGWENGAPEWGSFMVLMNVADITMILSAVFCAAVMTAKTVGTLYRRSVFAD